MAHIYYNKYTANKRIIKWRLLDDQLFSILVVAVAVEIDDVDARRQAAGIYVFRGLVNVEC